MQVGLGPDHIVLDGDPAPLLQRDTAPPIFGPYLLWLNGCMDQDATWYGCRPWPKRLCARWGPASPSPKRGRSAPPLNFRFMSIVAKQLDGSRWHLTWRWALVQAHCARWGPSSLPQKGAQPPNFRPIFIVSTRKMRQDTTWYGGRPQPR